MEKITLTFIANACNGKLHCSDSLLSGDLLIDAVSTNSREVKELSKDHSVLFVPIVGEKTDAHRFIADVKTSGGTAAFISSSYLASEDGQKLSADMKQSADSQFALIEVADTLAALQQVAAAYRMLFSIPVIGITGSVGKTTTKEMVAAALESGLVIHKTAGNQNSQIGLPLTIFGLEHRHQAAVIEMGMSEFGEMARIAAVARPDHAIVTNIGVAHIGNLGSQENIRKEKLHIADYFHAGSHLILNGDDPLLAGCPLQTIPEGLVTLHYGEGEAAEYRATDIKVSGMGQDFTLQYRTENTIRHLPVHLQVLGIHNVRNALAALAIAKTLGVSLEAAARGLSSYAPLSMRGNLISVKNPSPKEELPDTKVLDDSYNASPDSMKSSIQVLSSLPDVNRRIVVFADVLELGERSGELHQSVGRFLASHNASSPSPIDYLITIGPESRHIEAGYHAAFDSETTDSKVDEISHPDRLITRHFDNNTDAIDYLKSVLTPGDGILIKGSRGMKTDEIVHAITQ